MNETVSPPEVRDRPQSVEPAVSAELGAELDRLERAHQAEIDRRRAEDLARFGPIQDRD